MHKRNSNDSWDDRLIEGLISLLSRFDNSKTPKQGARKKFLGYHDLLNLLKSDHCPVCSIISRSLRHYTATVFAEQATDGVFRTHMQERLGYCRKHCVYVEEIIPREVHGLGVAIVYDDILSGIKETLRREPLQPIPQQKNCSLCELEEELQSYAIQLLADYCNDDDFRRAYSASSGVCFPHLLMLCEQLNDSAVEYLLADHNKKLSVLLNQLEEFQRKNNYRFRHEPMTAAEKTSWKRAVTFVVGDMA
jgi:hypothetical protein